MATALTQNVEFLLDSTTASTMLSNSEFIVMLTQATRDAESLSDLLYISGEQWKDVLSLFAVRYSANEPAQNPIAVMDDANISNLRTVMNDMNSLSHTIETIETEKTVTSTNDEVEEVTTTETITTTTLIISVDKKTPIDMADLYFFTEEQKEFLDELLS